MLNMDLMVIESATLSYKVLGDDKIDLVIEMGLGASAGEWLHIAEALSKTHTVLLYERAGYGSSGRSKLERTPENIAFELHELLSKLPHEEKITILAHSQGGLYAQQFARCYTQSVKRLVLLDPLSANDMDFKKHLSKKEYKGGGVDKSGNFRLPLILARLHMGGLIKKAMQSAPPFYYYDKFGVDEKEYILNAFTRPLFYETAIQEYKLAHEDEHIAGLKEKENFPQIPLYLITHSSEKAVSEIMSFGRLSESEAEKVEEIWQKLMKEYLSFSDKSCYAQANNSSHYIHLTDSDMLREAVEKNI